MCSIVTRVCYGHVNPRTAFLDRSWALFQVRKKEVEKQVEKNDDSFFKIVFQVSFSWSKSDFMIFSGESKNRKRILDSLYGGTPYSLSLDSTVKRK